MSEITNKSIWNAPDTLPADGTTIVVLKEASVEALRWEQQNHNSGHYDYSDWLAWAPLLDVVLSGQYLAKLAFEMSAALGGLQTAFKQMAEKSDPVMAMRYEGYAEIVGDVLTKIGAMPRPTLADVVVMAKNPEEGAKSYFEA